MKALQKLSSACSRVLASWNGRALRFLAVLLMWLVGIAGVRADQTTITFDTGGLFLRNQNGELLTAGTVNPGDGCRVELGYYQGATPQNKFSGIWVPLTGPNSQNTAFVGTSIGDSPTQGASHGQVALSLTFVAGSTASGVNLPPSGALLSLRFYDAVGASAAAKFNAVSNSAWVWQVPGAPPANPILAFSLDDPGIEWQGTPERAVLGQGPQPVSLTWANPADIVYGQRLGQAQLNASSGGVAGVFTYTLGTGGPASNALLAAGAAQTLHVSFAPADSTSFLPASSTVQINVNKAALTVRANNKSRTLGSSNPIFDGVITGFVNGESAQMVGLTVAYSTTATAQSSVGTYPITPSGPNSLMNYLVSYEAGVLSVLEKQIPQVTWTAPAPLIYGVPLGPVQQNAEVVGGVAGNFVYSPAPGTVLGAGNGQVLSVTFNPVDSINYASVTRTVSINVLKKALVVRANNKSRTVGTANPVFDATFDGLTNGDLPGGIGLTVNYETNATQQSPAGSYPITASGPGEIPNYTVSYQPGALTVTNKIIPSLTWAAPADITYGAPLTSTQLNATSGNVQGTFAYSPVAGTLLRAGQAQNLTVTFTPSDSATYAPATLSVSINVRKKTLTVRANNLSRVYGNTQSVPFTASYDGFVQGDDPSRLGGSLNFASNGSNGAPVGPSTPVGDYSITPSGLSSPDYEIVPVNGTLTVTRASLTVKANDKSRSVGDNNPILDLTYTGFVNGDQPESVGLGGAALAVTTSANAQSPAGSYPITVTGPNQVPNYDVVYQPGTLTVVNKMQPVLTWQAPAEITYGTALSTVQLNAVAALVAGGTSVPGEYIYVPNAGTVLPAGSQTLAVTFNPADTVQYSPITRTVVIQVKPRDLTITARSAEKVYGQVNPVFEADFTGLVSSDTPTSLGLRPTFTVIGQGGAPVGQVLSAGSYGIQPGGASHPNYSVRFVNGTFTVTKASLTVTANNKTRAFGAANPAFDATYSGLVPGETPSNIGLPIQFGCDAVQNTPAGKVPIRVFSSSTPPNYAVTFVNGELTISEKKVPVITWNPPTEIVYGVTLTNANYSNAIARFGNTTVAGTYTYSPTSGSVLGAGGGQTLSVTFTPENAEEYETVTRVVSVNVLRKGLTITARPQSRFYADSVSSTAQEVGDLVTITGLNVGDAITGPNFSGSLQVTSAGNAVNGSVYVSPAGNYPLTPGGLSSQNYQITYVAGSLEIKRVDLTVKADEKTRAPGGAEPSYSATFTGFRNGDDAQRIGLQLFFSSTATPISPAGNYPITVSGQALTANYTVTYQPGVLAVSGKLEPELTWADPAPITYGTGLSNVQLNAVARVGTTSVAGTFVYTPAIGTVLGAGDQQELSVTFNPTDSTKYASTTRKVRVNVLRRALTITAGNRTRVYGGELSNSFAVDQYAGFAPGDDSSKLTGTVAFSCRQPNGQDVGVSTPVGTYPIVPSGLSSPNYEIVYAPGFLAITKKDLTVFVQDATKVYGEANPAFVVAAVSGDLVTGDTLSGAVTGAARFNTSAVATSPVGSYAVTLDGLASANYNLKYDGRGRLTVTRRALTVRANDKTRVQNTANPVFDASYSGLIAPDTVASLRLNPTFTTTATNGSPAGTYPIAPSAGLPAAAGNYAVTYESGVLTVVAGGLSVPSITWANPADIIYGTALGSTQLNAVIRDGANTLTSEHGTITYSPAIGTVLGAGNSQQLTVTFSPNPGSTLASVSRTVAITVKRKPLTILALPAGRLVGEANPSFTAGAGAAPLGLVNGDELQATSGLAVNFNCVAGPNSPAGAYDILPFGATTTNYEVTYQKGTLTVSDKGAARITWATPADITYGTPLGEAQLNAVNASSGEIPGTFLYEPAAGAILRGGVQTLRVTFTPNDTAANRIVTQTVKLNVLRKPITLTADDKTRNFGEANPTFTASYSADFVSGDGPSSLPEPIFNCVAAATSPGGIYDIRIAPLNSPDYAVTIVNGKLTVADSGVLSFTSSTFSVVRSPAGDVVQQIKVRRTRGKLGSVSAVVSVTPGTATDVAVDAENGDYAIAASPVTLVWGDNEDGEKQFEITLKSTAQLASSGDTVLLALDAGEGNPSVGELNAATVILTDGNSNKPAVTLSSPTSGAKLAAESVLFKGQATGTGISRVEVVMNGGEIQEADLVPVAGSTTKFDWSLSAVPKQGVNTVVVTAYDIQGDASNPVTRKFSFAYLRPLLAATYDGLLVPTVDANNLADQHGMLTLTLDRAGAFTGRVMLGGVAIGFKGTLQTDLSEGLLFGNPPEHVGPEESGYEEYLAELENLKKLKLTRTVNKQLQTLGYLTLRVDDSGEYPVVVGELIGEDDLSTDEVEAVVLSTATSKKAVYSAAKVLPEGMLRIPMEIFDAANEKGSYTALFVTDDNSTVLDRALYPQGAGSARVTVTNAGTVTIAGRLADGTAISLSSRLSPDNDMPMYAALYSAKGFISGGLQFDDSALETDAFCESMVWFRPNTRTASTKNLTTLYPDGWPEGITMQVLGSKYVAPAKATLRAPNPPNPNTVLGASVAGVVAPTTNLSVILADGALPAETLNPGGLSATSALTVYAAPEGVAGANQLKISFVASAGTFSGSFLHPVSKKTVTLSGVAFQKTGQALGSFLYMPVVATDPEGTPQSGSVVIGSESGD